VLGQRGLQLVVARHVLARTRGRERAGEPEDDRVFINPRFSNPSTETHTREEGCLSMPHVTGEITGFDMTEILDMTTERMAVLSYIFRQIERVVEDRRPTIIILDEAWKLLDDPYFGARLENWLVTLRKMNCVAIMMTQYPSQLEGSRVGKTIVETVPTQILFPNDRAKSSDFDFLRVNEKEAALLTQPTLGQRIALVRSAGDSVFVDVDLSALGSVSTIHAETAELAIDRLAIMVLQAGTPLTFAEVREYIRKSIDVIVQLGRVEGRRGVTEFYLPGAE